MWWDDLYPKMGLTPLDEHLQWFAPTAAKNKYRMIGATTWMMVGACNELLNKRTASLVVESLSLDMLRSLMQRAGLVIKWESKGQNEIRVHTGVSLWWGLPIVQKRNPQLLPGKRFIDSEWKQRAIRRLQGPHAMIVRLDPFVDNQTGRRLYSAYAEEDEFLMTLDEAGAKEAEGRGAVITPLVSPVVKASDWELVP